MKRRSFIAAAAAAPVGMMFAQGGSTGQFELPKDVGPALEEFRKSIPSNFDQDYVQHAVIPFFLTSIFEGGAADAAHDRRHAHQGERAALRPLGSDLRRLEARLPTRASRSSCRAWRSAATHNLRKRIYLSAVTPDLYQPKYQAKGRCRSSTSCSIRSSPASRSCGTISTTTSISTGICISA